MTDLVFFNIAINKKVQSSSLWQNGSGFKNVFTFALYLNLSYLAKFNLSQALFKIYMKFDMTG